MAATTAASFSTAFSAATRSAAERAEFVSVRSTVKLATSTFSAQPLAGAAVWGSQAPASNVGNVGSRRVSTSVQASDVEAELAYSQAAPPQGSKLYVGNLPFNVDSETLAGVFNEVAEVDQVDVIYDRETGRSRGFAFVTMSSVEGAEAAISRLDGSELGGRLLKVNFPAARGERPPRTERSPRFAGAGAGSGTKLYVGNLSWGMDDFGLSDLFSEFGTVLEAKVVMDRETGKSRGFGFVTFNSANESNEAVSALDGVEVDGRQLKVSVAQDRPRESRPRY